MECICRVDRKVTLAGVCVLGSPYAPGSKDFAAYALNPLLAQVARLSASCPALNEAPVELEVLGGSLGSSPLHQSPSRKGSGTPLYPYNSSPQI